jgi:chromosome segregation protein
MDELQADQVAAGAEVERATVARRELEREGAELQVRMDLLAGRLLEEEKALAEVRQESSGQDDHLKSLRVRHAEISRRARELGEDLHRHQVELAGLEARLEQARTRLEEVGDLEELPEESADFDLEKARAQARRLRSFLENFGSVNLGAREDFERLTTRHVELKAQIEDLEEASDGLKRIMAEMDRASITQFQTVFQQVNETFGRLFGEIFGGGWARLELCNPEDLLESGVEIVACPPGKKLQNLTLLSSGERALSAIVFLLSLLTHKPSPIVVLDELDAPLDDANVEKVATRLLEFSTSSQFLVITHNRKTMEFADRLYGVTMEEPGVSRLLSVELRGEYGEKLEGRGGARRADSRKPEAVLA